MVCLGIFMPARRAVGGRLLFCRLLRERLQGKSVVCCGITMLPHRLDDHQDGHAGEQGRRDQLEDDETEQQRKIQRYDDEPQNEHNAGI